MLDPNFIRITTLALADSVNPCAIAVLTMVLMSILVQNPNKRKKVLYAGLAFTASVYIGYMFYSAILYQLFHSVTAFLAGNSGKFKIIMGLLGIILGGLNIKDYFAYKPGSLATEMPIFMRPKVKKIINEITSPKGAFIIGFLVTLFLLPCTAGPLLLATGILSELTVAQVIPWLIYYNLLFVLPMLIIVGIVYWGFAKVDEVSGWKERNIRMLHLIAGILLLLIGIGLLMGWV